MKKVALNAFLILSGFVVGFATCAYLFAVDVDLLAVPYLNKPVVLDQTIHIKQGDIETVLPKGTQLVHYRSAFENDEMYVPVGLPWRYDVSFKPLDKRAEYFWLEEDKSSMHAKRIPGAGKP